MCISIVLLPTLVLVYLMQHRSHVSDPPYTSASEQELSADQIFGHFRRAFGRRDAAEFEKWSLLILDRRLLGDLTLAEIQAQLGRPDRSGWTSVDKDLARADDVGAWIKRHFVERAMTWPYIVDDRETRKRHALVLVVHNDVLLRASYQRTDSLQDKLEVETVIEYSLTPAHADPERPPQPSSSRRGQKKRNDEHTTQNCKVSCQGIHERQLSGRSQSGTWSVTGLSRRDRGSRSTNTGVPGIAFHRSTFASRMDRRLGQLCRRTRRCCGAGTYVALSTSCEIAIGYDCELVDCVQIFRQTHANMPIVSRQPRLGANLCA